MNPHCYPFSPEIDRILSPHVHVLEALVREAGCGRQSPSQIPGIPTLDSVRDAGSLLRGDISPKSNSDGCLGDIDAVDFGRIVNWMYTKIPGAQDTFHTWLGCVPTAHAITLVILERNMVQLMQDPHFPTVESKAEQHCFLLQKAWQYQTENVNEDILVCDVDRECLFLFELCLFSMSREATWSHEQWGLDAGDHQQNWSPYQNLPQDWRETGLCFSASELIVSPFVETLLRLIA